MLVPFLIMLREGVEAALIVGIIAGYLKRTGRQAWLPAVWVGVLLATTLSLVVGFALDLAGAEFPQRQQEVFEGVVGLVAVAILTSMVFWMKKVARSIKGQIHDSIDAALAPGRSQGLALVGMAFFAVAREGLESVFFLLATFQQESGLEAPAGALLGILAAIAVGLGIYHGGVRLNLRLFFRWTGLFILVVAAGLLAGSVRALHEAGLWNGLQHVVFDLSGVLSTDGPVGAVLAGLVGYQDMPTLGEVIAWGAFVLVTVPLFVAGTLARPVAAAGLSR